MWTSLDALLDPPRVPETGVRTGTILAPHALAPALGRAEGTTFVLQGHPLNSPMSDS